MLQFISCVFPQQLTPARRHVIRPAAKWSGGSRNLIQVAGFNSSTSGFPTSEPSSAPSTSRDAKVTSSIIRPAVQPQPGPSSHTLSQPNSQPQDGLSAHTNVELRPVSVQITSTSTDAKANAASSREPVRPQPQPGTSGLPQPQAGSSAHLGLEPHAGTSAGATPYVRVVAVAPAAGEKACASILTHDNPQTSSAQLNPHTQTQPQPGTSSQLQVSRTAALQTRVIQVKQVKVVVLPQQPSIRASALITQPQLQLRTQNHRMQGNLIQIEPQPLAQAPAQLPVQPPQAPQVIPVTPPAVLIAAAPERLGPPEAGHRIILGSQVPGEAVPNPPHQAGAHRLNMGVPNAIPDPPAPPALTASVPNDRGEEARLILAPAPNPEWVNPAPGLVMVPPAPEDVPRIEDARPGPSEPRERAGQQPHVRALITGVVSITETFCIT